MANPNTYNRKPSGRSPKKREDQGLANTLGPELTNAFLLAEYGQPMGDLEDQQLRAELMGLPEKNPLHSRIAGVLEDSPFSNTQGHQFPSRIPPTEDNLLASVFADAEENQDLIGGGGLTANSGLGYGMGMDNPDVVSFYRDMTSGTPFSGMGPAGIENLVNNPRVLAQVLAEQEGAGPNAAAFLGPRAEAALALSGMGLLGRSSQGLPNAGMPGMNLTSSPTSDVDKLLAAQEFLDQFNHPGSQFVDVNAIYQESFDRAANTNFEGLTGEGGQPLGIEESISLTNDALMASSPFMSQETQAWLSSALNAAAVEYMAKVSTGEITMSYPNYLRTLGIDKMLSGA